jgi:glyoxylase-like metal-dependent hydrolase (beta-lactamase superfamily II)
VFHAGISKKEKRRVLMNALLKFWLAFCLVFMAAGPALGENGLVKISEHVYSYIDVKDGSPANSYGANAGIVIGEDTILVVDTLVSSREGKRLLKDIRAVSDKPIRYVVNTHYHLDHTFGNGEFAGLGADIISHADCAAAMRNNSAGILANAGGYGLTPEDMAGTELAYPEVTFTDRMTVNPGGIDVKLIHIAPSHSIGSIVVYIPTEKVIFAGDILFTDYHPYMADGDIDGWRKTLDFIISLNAEKIIPGHGPLSTNKDLSDMRAYIGAFDKKARELAGESKEVEHIVSEIKKSMPARTRGEGLIQANIQGKYLKAEDNQN